MNLVRDDRPSRRMLSPWFSFPSILDDDDFTNFSASTDINMWEDENKVYAQFAVPGMKESDIDVTLENGVLTVRAAKEENEEKKEKAKKIYSSSMRRNYYYSTTLPSTAGHEVDANLEDGVLTVEVMKAEERKPKKIEVKKK